MGFPFGNIEVHGAQEQAHVLFACAITLCWRRGKPKVAYQQPAHYGANYECPGFLAALEQVLTRIDRNLPAQFNASPE
jgi:hypothetical protein